jgi:hypothetical protein
LEEVGDDIFNNFIDIFVTLSVVFIELIHYHLSELLALLYGLCLFYS